MLWEFLGHFSSNSNSTQFKNGLTFQEDPARKPEKKTKKNAPLFFPGRATWSSRMRETIEEYAMEVSREREIFRGMAQLKDEKAKKIARDRWDKL